MTGVVARDSVLDPDEFLRPCSRDDEPHEHWRILFVQDGEVTVQDWGYHSAHEARRFVDSAARE